MNIDWQKSINPIWRQVCGVALIVGGIVSASFYYIEMNTLSKGMITTAPAKSSNIIASPAAPGAATSPSATQETPKNVSGKIKLSTATQAELETLPGIGPSKAMAIIGYRDTYGFKSVNDLSKVKGIGAKTLEQLKPLLDL